MDFHLKQVLQHHSAHTIVSLPRLICLVYRVVILLSAFFQFIKIPPVNVIDYFCKSGRNLTAYFDKYV